MKTSQLALIGSDTFDLTPQGLRIFDAAILWALADPGDGSSCQDSGYVQARFRHVS